MIMAKSVKEVQDGDIKSNVVILKSVFGKVGQKYFIQPQRDKYGKFPDCVKRVNSAGDIILTDEELKAESRGEKAYIKENAVFVIEDGKTFNLDDVYDAAVWESIKNCSMIAPDRFAKNEKGEYLIDGTTNSNTKNPRYGAAELYVYRPGMEAQRRVSRKKLYINACNYIMNDERGYEGRLLVARVLGRNMKNMPNADVEDFLLSVADKTPEKIISCYTEGDMKLRILFIEAREKNVIYKKDGLYLYGEDGKVILGATDDAAIEWMKTSKNAKTLALIRKDTYPEMFED
jgi:hypothetical protein